MVGHSERIVFAERNPIMRNACVAQPAGSKGKGSAVEIDAGDGCFGFGDDRRQFKDLAAGTAGNIEDPRPGA
jgi:hypothetical protein